MRKIKEVVRLKWDQGLSERQIAKSCCLSRSTVSDYITRVTAAGLNKSLIEDMDDKQLSLLLFSEKKEPAHFVQPDWQQVHKELKRKGVTLQLLWKEYVAVVQPAMGYSHFCRIYREFKSQLNPVMRQSHKAGEKLFVDYSGLTVSLTDQQTGEIKEAQIFVAVFGASNYTYIEATHSQSLSDWIGSHVRAFYFFGGVPHIVVPDNLKAGVTQAHRYDPDINPTYQAMAIHYDIAVVPARARKPQDKAKVEVGVQGIERDILAPLRDRTFFSLAEINAALQEPLKAYNAKPFQKLQGSRQSEFIAVDKPALKSLPAQRYVYGEWKKVRAGIDYHIAFEGHYYSVPYKYLKKELDLQFTATQLTCFYQGKSIAVHTRVYRKGHTTIHEHMPTSHQAYAEWTPERIIKWAHKIGQNTEQFIEALIASRPQPEQAYRACLGILRLGQTYGEDRLENASLRALVIEAFSYKSIHSILKNSLDKLPLPSPNAGNEPALPNLLHDNIRGAGYYN